ncbi:MAG TPA: DUF4332 domain-containing protein [Myxococcota bacterium]|nr:DUF4332 domain-containing protein [Myxococcota bacterium]
MRRHLAILVLACAGLVPVSASAGHYGVESIGLFDDQMIQKMVGLGLEDTSRLWSATTTPAKRREVARKLSVRPATVQEWHQFCDLLRVDGVGPKIARLMTHAGVRDLKSLAKQNPSALVPKLKAVRSKVPELGKFPDEGNLQDWVAQAVEMVRKDRNRKPGR